MPIEADLAFIHDDQHRQIATLTYDGDMHVLSTKLIYPTLTDIKRRSLLLRGFEQSESGQLYAQAWECELVRTR